MTRGSAFLAVLCLTVSVTGTNVTAAPLEMPACPIDPGDAGKMVALNRLISPSGSPPENNTGMMYVYTGRIVGPLADKYQQALARTQNYSTISPARFYGSKFPFPPAHAQCVAMREMALLAACRLKGRLLSMASLPAADSPPAAISLGIVEMWLRLRAEIQMQFVDWGILPHDIATKMLNALPADRAKAEDAVP